MFSFVVLKFANRIWQPLVVLVTLSSITAGCGQLGQDDGGPTQTDQQPVPPNVILVVIDTLRADHLSTYGYVRPTSPILDRLAENALVYENAFTVMSHTLPAHVSLMTGVHTATHKVLNNRWRYQGSHPLLAQLLKQRGYATAAFVAGFPLRAESGLDAGFDLYEDTTMPDGRLLHKVAGERITSHALKWLESQQEGPFFLFVHYFDTHFPYEDPPDSQPPFKVDQVLADWMSDAGISDIQIEDIAPTPIPLNGKLVDLPMLINAYDNQIHRVDHLIGQLLETLKRLQLDTKTLLIITSDHGEGLGQHAYYAHGLHLYEEQLRIPLIVRPPTTASWQPGRIESTVSLLDLAPTVLDLVGLEPPPASPGIKLPLAPSSGTPKGRSILAERRFFLPEGRKRRGRFAAEPTLHVLRGDNPMKYFLDGDGTEQLYDLSTDPSELHNLASQRPEQCARLHNDLQSLLEDRTADAAIVEQKMDEQTERALRALGYIR